MGDLMGNDAYVSDCGKYRYSLIRHVGAGQLRFAFFGINPSTADARLDDATVRKWRGYCERNNGALFEVANVFSYRATDVKELANVDDPFGGNEHWRVQESIIRSADVLVPCWGRQKKVADHLRPWIDELFGRLCDESNRPGKFLMCFGKTKDGDPKHPLMLGYDKDPLVPL